MPMIRKSAGDCAAYRIKASDTNYFILMADPASDGIEFVTVIEIFEPGGATPPNAHVAAHEQFVVLAGSGVARCDGREAMLERGDILIVPPGTEHVVENPGPGKLYCLTTMIPDEGFAELIRGGIPVEIDAADRLVLTERLGVRP